MKRLKKTIKCIVSSSKENSFNLILIMIFSCIYFINNIFIKKYTDGLVQLFFNCYFNDLICPIIFFSYTNILLVTANRELTNLRKLLLIGMVCSLVWEWIGPLLNTSSISDINDVFFYIAGTVLYWCMINIYHYVKSV